MAVNKVDFGGETLIDLSGDTVTPETLLNGTTAHAANGDIITGTYVASGGEVPQEVMILTGEFDMTTALISNLSHDYTQIINALKENKFVIAKITTLSMYGNTILYGYPSWSATGGMFQSDLITFTLVGKANFDGQGSASLLNILTMNKDGTNNVEINVLREM